MSQSLSTDFPCSQRAQEGGEQLMAMRYGNQKTGLAPCIDDASACESQRSDSSFVPLTQRPRQHTGNAASDPNEPNELKASAQNQEQRAYLSECSDEEGEPDDEGDDMLGILFD